MFQGMFPPIQVERVSKRTGCARSDDLTHVDSRLSHPSDEFFLSRTRRNPTSFPCATTPFLFVRTASLAGSVNCWQTQRPRNRRRDGRSTSTRKRPMVCSSRHGSCARDSRRYLPQSRGRPSVPSPVSRSLRLPAIYGPCESLRKISPTISCAGTVPTRAHHRTLPGTPRELTMILRQRRRGPRQRVIRMQSSCRRIMLDGATRRDRERP
jgi:hypothetical protein